MNLTNVEVFRLRKLKQYREHPPTDSLMMLGEAWKIKTKIIPPALAIIALTAVLGYLFRQSSAAFFIAGCGFGLLCGVFTCFLLWLRVAARQWRLTREIVDWARVEQLLEAKDDQGV